MAEPRMKVSLNEDQTQACLTLLPASGMEGDVPLTLEQLTILIFRLGEARAALMAKQPVPPIEGSPVVPVYRTRWAVQPEALTEGSMLAFQHPAYGPVGVVLPPSDVEKIVRSLTAHLAMLHPKEGKPS